MDVETARGTIEVIERGSGPALLLLHPFPFDAGVWSDALEALSSAHRVIAPNLRGFGRTAPFDEATPPSVDAMADDVAALLDALAITEPVALGGLSMGGYVALAFARRHRARLRGLLLADTRAEPDDDAGRAKRDASIARVVAGDVRGVVEEMLEKLAGDTTRAERPDVLRRMRELMLEAPAETIAKALVALRDRPDARPSLASLDVPALVLVGAEDVVTPPSTSEAMAKALPRATLETIPAAGHITVLEAPAVFFTSVQRWLHAI